MPVTAVAFSGDAIFAGGFDGSVRAFDLASAAPLWRHEMAGDGAIVNEIAASDRHSLLLVVAEDHAPTILDTASGAVRGSFDSGGRLLEGPSFDPELPRAYVFDRRGAENRIIVLDLADMTSRASYPAGQSAILGKAWGAMLPGADTLAYISGNGELSWRDTGNTSLRGTRALIAAERSGGNDADVTLFEFHAVSPDLRQIAFTHRRSGTLSVFALEPQSWPGTLARADAPGAAQIVATLLAHGPAGGMLTSDWRRLAAAVPPLQDDHAAWLVFSEASKKGGRFVAAGDRLFLFDTNGGRIEQVVSSAGGNISAVAATSDEAMAITGGPQGEVTLWNVSDGTPIATWALQHDVAAIAVLPGDDGALVMTDRLHRLDFGTLEVAEIATAPLTGIRAALYRNNHRFVLTSKSGLWSGPLDAPHRTIFIREDGVEAAAFLGNSDVLAVGTDRGLHLYDAAAGVRIATLAMEGDGYFAAPDFIAFDPSSATLVVLSGVGLATFDVSGFTGMSWRRALCTALGANLAYPEAQRLLSGRACHRQQYPTEG